jgi:hypothetical protein
MKDTGFGVPEGQRDRIAPRYELDKNLKLFLAADQSAFPTLVGNAAGVKPKYLLAIAGLIRQRRTICASPRCWRTAANSTACGCCRQAPSS